MFLSIANVSLRRNRETGTKGFSLLYSTHVFFISREQMSCIFPITYLSVSLKRSYAILHVHDFLITISL